MPTYRIEFTTAAKRELASLPIAIVKRIDRELHLLSMDPRPRGVKKMKGPEGYYRIRVGNCRIICDIQDSVLLVYVIHIRHRRDACRS